MVESLSQALRRHEDQPLVALLLALVAIVLFSIAWVKAL
jgi:hypothetical protein